MSQTQDAPQNTITEPVSKHFTFPNVYLARTKWSLSKMDRFVIPYGQFGFARIVYDRQGSETDRTIVLTSESTYTNLCSDGFGESKKGNGFNIVPFKLNENSLPGNGKTKNLFIPVPFDWRRRH